MLSVWVKPSFFLNSNRLKEIHMTYRIFICAASLFLLAGTLCFSQSLIVSQVDNSSLLMDQKIKV
jgi:uncharacterized membrane protein YgdD (TMEM256/DUF423 family)